MKVRITLDVSPHDRYVIAKYWRGHDGEKPRARATRKQVARFAQASLKTAVADHLLDLDRRGRSNAARLKNGVTPGETLQPPREQDRRLPW